MDEAALTRLERQRVELEGQIAQLRKSLRHWQTLEIDYEGLKEEFSLLSEDCSIQEALDVAKDFAADLVDEQEIRSLFGVDKGVKRSPAQVVDLLSKRVDYVSRNAFTIKKQLSDAEKKRNALLLAKEPDYREEAGLPLTEVTEELDNDGNVVSSKLETAQTAAPQLLEVLKKAGVDDLIEQDGVVTAASKSDQKLGSDNLPQSASLEQTDTPDQPKEQQLVSKLPEQVKRVKSPSPQPSLSSTTISPPTDHQPAKGLPIKSSSIHLDEDNDSTADSADFPTNPNDNEEDAALRREMLEYARSEIGPIVAQLELEEDASEISYDEDEDQFSLDSELDDESGEEDVSEDEYGQTKSPVISNRYRRKMEQLEQKLGLKEMKNLGPEPDVPVEVAEDLQKPPPAEAARKAAIKRAEAAAIASSKNAKSSNLERQPTKKSKKVSFANDLDIAEETNFQPQSKAQDKLPKTVPLPPVTGSVIERNPSTTGTDSSAYSTTQPKKVSRFKAAREATPQTSLFQSPETNVLSAPPPTNAESVPQTNKIMSPAIIERPDPPNSGKAPAPDPYDFDETLHKQEIAGEYYKSRNRMIQRQGGFIREDEDENYGESTAPLPVIDEETGKVKKISRFKAARLR
jgi:unconventional prefoldin RPB5 interactor 1